MEFFEIERQIGVGAFGEVFLVKSKASGERYVLKKIKIASKKQLQNAIKEMQLLKGLDHPNIVRYRDSYPVDGGKGTRFFIEMEYCEKGDLETMIENRNGERFSQDEVLSWFAQLCSAIGYIHGLGVLHRDLKSQNIFLTSDSIVKIGDFGISTVLENKFDNAVTTCGTKSYMAPEILRKAPYNEKCDIWSLGCVLFEMITLETPFPGGVFSSVVTKSPTTAPVPSGCSESVKQTVGMMLKYEPRERASINEVIQELGKTRPPNPQLVRSKSRDGGVPIVDCDGCRIRFAGIRFKCVECRDYDLCMACVQSGKHAEHAMLRTSPDIEEKWVHANIKCHGCSETPIQGIRFKCSQCKDYDLCQLCFRVKLHPYHKFTIMCDPSL